MNLYTDRNNDCPLHSHVALLSAIHSHQKNLYCQTEWKQCKKQLSEHVNIHQPIPHLHPPVVKNLRTQT